MVIGKIIGTVWATHKNQRLTGHRLALVRPIDNEANEKGNMFVAIDPLGAGLDDVVLILQGSSAGKSIEGDVPCDAVVVALVEKFRLGSQ